MTRRFTLVSWNVFQGLHHESRRYRRVRNPAINDQIASLDADVLVLPEAWRFADPAAAWVEDLAAELGYEVHQWISDGPSRPREVVPWRMVVLTRIPARSLAPWLLPEVPGLGRRAVVRLELEELGITLAGVHLYGIHLLRFRQVRGWWRERNEFAALAARHDIVAGDMNMWGPVVRRSARALKSAVHGRTYPARRPHSQIDHVLYGPRVQVASSRVLPEMGSDHLALQVAFDVSDTTQPEAPDTAQ